MSGEAFARVIERLTDVLNELLQKTEPGDSQVIVGPGVLTIASGQVSSLGNNTLITPAAGTRIRVYYASYNPLLAVEAAFRFGTAGSLWLRNNVTANSVIAKDFGDLRFIQGAVGEAVILNLSLAVGINWNLTYLEV